MSNKRKSTASKLKGSPFKETGLSLNEGNGITLSFCVETTPELEQVWTFGPFEGGSFLDRCKTPTMNSSASFSRTLATPLLNSCSPFQAIPPKTSKRYNGEICCFCKYSLQLTLPGEVVLPLKCEHVCHKNCFSMLLDPEDATRLPICDLCKEPTNVIGGSIYREITHNVLESSKDSNTSESSLSEEEIEIPTEVATPVLSQKHSKALFSTPTKQEKNTQLITPPSTTHGIDYEQLLYNPNITCTSEMHPIKLNESLEISYVLNIKPPTIYNYPNPSFSIIEQQLKWKVSGYISQRLRPSEDLGELIIFDKMKISVDGEAWDDSCIYLFSKYLLLYSDEHDALAGQISIEDSFGSANLSEGVLNLNLAESTLPELYIYNEFSQTITEKWSYVVQKLIDKQQAITNLFQFTSTCWLDLEIEYGLEIPNNLILFNNLLLQRGELPNLYMSKILPYPQQLVLNLVVAVPLFNKTKLSNDDYLCWLQNLLSKIRSTLSALDKMAIIFLGVDGLHEPKRSGTFVGCVVASWDGWSGLINDISLVTNTFGSNYQELKVALEKCADLYPFISCQENSINKILVISCGNYKDTPQVCSKLDKDGIKTFSLTILRVGSHLDLFDDVQVFSKFEYGDDSVLRFATPNELSMSIEPLIRRIKSVCVPYLQIELQTENNTTISSMELIGSMESMISSSQIIWFRGITPSYERNFLVTFKLRGCQQNQSLLQVPIFKYTATWRDNKMKKTVYAKLDTVRSPSTPAYTDTTKVSEATNAGSVERNHPSSMYFLDIPLLPPLSPRRDASFAKRQAELLIVQYLRQAISGKSASSLKACISVAYGLLKSISHTFEADNITQTMEPNTDAGDDNILDLMAITKSGKLENQKYVDFLVGQLENIVSLFNSDPSTAVDKCFDLIYSLV